MPPKLPIRLSPIAPAIMANDRRRLPVDKEKTDGAKHPGGNYAMYMVCYPAQNFHHHELILPQVTCVHDKNVKEERQKLIDIVKNAGCNVVLTAAASGGFRYNHEQSISPC